MVHGVSRCVHRSVCRSAIAGEGILSRIHLCRQHVRQPTGAETPAGILRGGDFTRTGAKPALIGISRGGLYAYHFAAENPTHVSVIYGDAPVCDFKSWPAGNGKGQGSKADWQSLMKLYGFKNEAEALAYMGNPIDTLPPLAAAGIAIIHVVGDADNVVPVEENTAIVEEQYRLLGGTMQVIHKPGVGHHPHGLDDDTPVVDFIVKHAAK